MKINKTIFVGILCLLLSAVIFTTDILNPFIRPVTYLFLMGSSKGKDIIFFGLFGLFLIFSQLFKKEYDNKLFLKLSIYLGIILLVFGIIIEVLFRLQMNIGLNTIFASMNNGMSSTSILHTHLIKSIVGEILNNIMGSFIQSNINTGVGLYSYVPGFAKAVVILIPVLFITLIFSNQNRTWPVTVFISFFSSCLIIGIIDGGLFGTPAIVGICGLILVYRNEFYFNYAFGKLLKDDSLIAASDEPYYKNKGFSNLRILINRLLPYFIIILILLLRFTIAFAGAESDYYTVNIVNPTDNINITDIPVEKINQTENSVTYKVNSDYNEMELLNDLKIPLNSSCEYYTLSWNIYSYM